MKAKFSIPAHGRPQHLLLFAAVILLICSFFNYSGQIDINLQDTYYVISYTILFGGIALALLLYWIIYLVGNSLLPVKALSWLHISSTIITFSAFGILTTSHQLGITASAHSHDALADFKKQMQWINFEGYLFIAAIVAQLFFIANLVTGLVKKITSPPIK
ncbi:hypothetical protein LX99_01561 [Mucilaginibacter oryzae]|uniref:Uncharacterized protein n=1 Tax=Mucilaginibacter oryzae TaxID=468058 RepID=A0A316HLK2_9SPHI|nr:hypothetical protein [Mucilaginibacter oryzae]PWK79105.1 hypothetical protein LX99_01561 [Mucilaginibacter oryzae]